MLVKDVVSNRYRTVDPDISVASIEPELLREGFLVVKQEGRFLGLLEPNDVLQRGCRLVADCLRQKQSLQLEESISNAHRELIETACCALPVFQEEHFRGVVTLKDILSYYEANLFQVEDVFFEVVDSINDCVLIYDPKNGDILHHNSCCRDLWPSAVARIPCKISDLFSSLDPALFFSSGGSRRRPVSLAVELDASARQQSCVLIQYVSSFLKSEYGVAILRRSSEDAETRTNAATTSQELTTLIEKNRSYFLQCVSHELRTPISGILNLVRILKQEHLPADAERYLEMLANAANNLHESVNDLLDFEQLEQGLFKLRREKFSLTDFLTANLELFEFMARTKHLSFSANYEIDQDLILIGDKVRLRQILLNIVSNSVKYTSQGGIVLLITCEQGDDQQVQLKIVVRDTGCGMEQESLDAIFRPYVRSDSTMAGRQEGFGLGLAISKQLVDLMEGRIHVESRPDSGTTF